MNAETVADVVTRLGERYGLPAMGRLVGELADRPAGPLRLAASDPGARDWVLDVSGLVGRYVYDKAPERNDPEFGPVDVNLLDHPEGGSVSRLHAHLRKEQGDWVLQDCGAVQGTELNGVRLQPEDRRALAEGDVVVFGRARFVVGIGEG